MSLVFSRDLKEGSRRTSENRAPDGSRSKAPPGPHCPVCAGTFEFLYSIDRFSPSFDILRCRNCGLERRAAFPADVSEFYDADYYEGRAEYSYRDERKKTRYDDYVFRARLKNIARFTAPPADFLDVGCAFGSFVAAAGRAGYRARGLDVSPYAVEEGRSRGLDLRRGELSPGVYPPGSFDVATLIEVLEHLPDPETALGTLAEILRPGGLLVLQTANYAGLQARRAGADYHYYLPGHLFYYSAANLRALLARHGFTRAILYRPVDFGLLPKLLKSRGDFQTPLDYLRWARIAWYHMKGKIAWRDFALTSSMVLYAFRD